MPIWAFHPRPWQSNFGFSHLLRMSFPTEPESELARVVIHSGDTRSRLLGVQLVRILIICFTMDTIDHLWCFSCDFCPCASNHDSFNHVASPWNMTFANLHNLSVTVCLYIFLVIFVIRAAYVPFALIPASHQHYRFKSLTFTSPPPWPVFPFAPCPFSP